MKRLLSKISDLVCFNIKNPFCIALFFCTFALHSYLYASIQENNSEILLIAQLTEEEYVDHVLDNLLGPDPSVVKPNKELIEQAVASSVVSEFSVGAGYGGKSNVLESGWWDLDSHQAVWAVDYFYARGGQEEDNILFYTYFENYNYPDIETEGDAQTFYAKLKAESQRSKSSKAVLELRYSYEQYLDESNAEIGETIPVAQELDGAAALKWEQELISIFNTSLEGECYELNSEFDDYDFTKKSIELKLFGKYGEDSEFGISAEAQYSDYDTDETLDLDGYSIDGKLLSIETRNYTVYSDHYFQGNNRINLSTDITFTTKRDNGPGYSNYDLYNVSEWLQIKINKWRFRENIVWRRYQYTERKIVTDSDKEELRYIENIELSAKVERLIGKSITIAAEVEWLKSESNDSDYDYDSDSYLVNMAVAF